MSLHVMILHEIPGLVPPDLWKSLRGFRRLCKCVSAGGRQGEGKCQHRLLGALEEPLLSGWRLLPSSPISNKYNYQLDRIQDTKGGARSFMRR